MNIINDPGRAASAGSAMGQGFGQGIGQGLSEMAQHHVEQIRQKQQQSKLYNALQQANLNPDMAAVLSQFRPQEQVKLMELFGPMMQKDEQQQESQQQDPYWQQGQVQQQRQPMQQAPISRQQQLADIFKPYNPMDEPVARQMQQNMQNSNN